VSTPDPAQPEFTFDPAVIDQEIAMLEDLRENVAHGWLQVGRDASSRLVFRITEEGKSRVEQMGQEK
jgi:hypothetical protein